MITSNAVTTKGGEEKLTFSTGAQRGTDEGKPQFNKTQPEYLFTLVNLLDNNKETIVYSYNGESFEVEHGEAVVGVIPFAETDTSMIPQLMLNRLGGLFWRGAQKYSRNNWKKGMNIARTFSSMFRHMVYWWAGDTSEDHLAAIIWNAAVIMWTENQIAEGKLPYSLADLGPMKGKLSDFPNAE